VDTTTTDQKRWEGKSSSGRTYIMCKSGWYKHSVVLVERQDDQPRTIRFLCAIARGLIHSLLLWSFRLNFNVHKAIIWHPKAYPPPCQWSDPSGTENFDNKGYSMTRNVLKLFRKYLFRNVDRFLGSPLFRLSHQTSSQTITNLERFRRSDVRFCVLIES